MRDRVALVVDDENLIRMMLSEILEEQGFIIYEAANGFDALQLYREHSPNVVVLDLYMPVLDGFGFLKESEVASNDVCDVIILTGNGGDKDKKKTLELGAKVFLEKPFDTDVLIDEVNKLITSQEI